MEKEKPQKWLQFFVDCTTHLVVVGIILLLFYPIAIWYFGARPLFGVDFYNTVSQVTILQKNLTLPQMAWLPNWFGGWPYLSEYPLLHFYIILFISFFTNVINATLIWMIIATAIFLIGVYAFLYEVSKSKILAGVLSIAAIYSVGVYGSLLWGGSLPFYATQALFPWTLFLIVRFIKNGQIRLLLAATLLATIGIYGHPQVVLTYLYPGVLLLLFFSSSEKLNLFALKRKLAYAFLFVSLSFIIGFPMIYQTFGQGLTHLVLVGGTKAALSTVHVDSSVTDTVAFNHAQPFKIYSDSNPLFFGLLIVIFPISILSLVFWLRGKYVQNILPYIVLTTYYIGYITIYAYGISIYHGGWYRLFWSVPIWLGGLIAIFWYEFSASIKHSVLKKVTPILLPLVIVILIGAACIVDTVLPNTISIGGGSPTFQELVKKFSTQKLTDPVGRIIADDLSTFEIDRFILRISDEGKAAFSSAYPMGLNVYPLDDGFKSALTPDFMKTPEAVNYRLYSADATYNVAAANYVTMPLARGYVDPPITDSDRGYLFWLDAAVTTDPTKGGPGLVAGFNYPEEIAKNHAWYLIDWNGIRYFEGGSWSAYSSPINDLVHNKASVTQESLVDISKQFPVSQHQELSYFEIDSNLTSPIVEAVNTPVVGIYASDSGFETVLRSFAATNLNTKKIIPVRLGKNLGNYSENDLRQFDAIILYDYDYTNSTVFNKLNTFAQNGGTIIIDSGVETKQSDNRKIILPDIFPFESLVREGLGSDWDISISDPSLVTGVDTSKFSPAVFNDTEWKFAFPKGAGQRSGVTVWLTNHGNPLLTESAIGSGKVIWSGMNIFYHISRYNNIDEAQFLKNILAKAISLDSHELSAVDVRYPSDRTIEISGSGARGVLVKAEHYPGWSAHLQSNLQTASLPIYTVGPSNPGYMYVALPKGTQAFTLNFNFRGSLMIWILTTISLITFILLTDSVILHGIIFGRILRKMYLYFNKKTARWWEKDDDE